MATSFKAGCVQLCADNDLNINIRKAENLTRQAHAAGAELICLPEYFAVIEVDDTTTLQKAVTEEDHPALVKFRSLAKELSVWMQIGSLPIRVSNTQVNNRAFLINPVGKIVARYNKIHLFDVTLKNGEQYRESQVVQAGTEAVIAQTPWGLLGMSICYDVRFPGLYRNLAQQGADYFVVPAAFTQTTGEAHWHVLLRARAIENGSYVIAACQSGVRHTGRATYGHSLIIDPWGEVLADAGEEEGYIIADIYPERVSEVRQMIPSLRHDRQYIQY